MSRSATRVELHAMSWTVPRTTRELRAAVFRANRYASDSRCAETCCINPQARDFHSRSSLTYVRKLHILPIGTHNVLTRYLVAHLGRDGVVGTPSDGQPTPIKLTTRTSYVADSGKHSFGENQVFHVRRVLCSRSLRYLPVTWIFNGRSGRSNTAPSIPSYSALRL